MEQTKPDTQTQTKTKTKTNQTMDSEKLDNLKSLNAMLLKETVERRQQVDSLVKSNESLESKLNQSVINNASIQLEMNSFIEKAAVFEIEKLLLSVFLNQLGEECLKEKIEIEKLVRTMRTDEEALERKYVSVLQKQVEMETEIKFLVNEKNELEERVETLGKEKNSVAQELEIVVRELEQKEVTIEEIEQQKTEMENAKKRGESEIVRLNEQVNVLKDTISLLETSRVNQVNELEIKVGRYKALFEQSTLEKHEALQSLDNEKRITREFKDKISGMEKEMQDLHQELSKMTTEIGKHVGEKNKLEDRCAELVKDVSSLETELAETRIEFDDTKGKLGVAEANTIRVLNILRKTLLVSDEIDKENGVEESGIKEHVKEVEAIKRAFKDKEVRLEEMKRQLELVKSSADEARKKKSFWTMVSSATTLLAAAVSVAYVVRPH